MSPEPKAPRQKIVDDVANRLTQQILSGEIPAGAMLPSERTLAEQMSVARSPVREALSRLEQMRLIEVRHGRGATVLNFQDVAGPEVLQALVSADASNALQVLQAVMEFRQYFGQAIGELYTRHADAEAIERLRSKYCDTPAKTRKEAIEQDFSLIEELTIGTGNLVLRLLFNSTRNLYLDSWESFEGLLPDNEHMAKAHRHILATIAQGDEQAAGEAVRSYFAFGLQQVEAQA